MAKRYGLDSIIGKKSTIRFPRSVLHAKTDTICTVVAANNVLSEPPFSTAITMKKGDALDICDSLNDISYEYENFFPVKANILLSHGIATIDLTTPTTFSLINIIYDLDDYIIEILRASLPNISLILANIALAKIDTQDSIFVDELLNHGRTLYGNINSYNCKRRKDKRINALKNFDKMQSNKINYIKSNLDSHRRDMHYFLKTKRVKKKERLPLLFDKIDDFYDLYEDWDEFHDEYYQDNFLNYYDNISVYLYLFELYILQTHAITAHNKIPAITWYQNIMPQYLRASEADVESSLILSYELVYFN
jgi:hypothetical protein